MEEGRGANGRFRAQTGQWWPFNLARGPAESPIKPRAVKNEQTAKPVPETDTHSLSLLLSLSSHSFSLNHFFFLFFSFSHCISFFWPEKGQEKRNTRAALAQLGLKMGRRGSRGRRVTVRGNLGRCLLFRVSPLDRIRRETCGSRLCV